MKYPYPTGIKINREDSTMNHYLKSLDKHQDYIMNLDITAMVNGEKPLNHLTTMDMLQTVDFVLIYGKSIWPNSCQVAGSNTKICLSEFVWLIRQMVLGIRDSIMLCLQCRDQDVSSTRIEPCKISSLNITHGHLRTLYMRLPPREDIHGIIYTFHFQCLSQCINRLNYVTDTVAPDNSLHPVTTAVEATNRLRRPVCSSQSNDVVENVTSPPKLFMQPLTIEVPPHHATSEPLTDNNIIMDDDPWGRVFDHMDVLEGEDIRSPPPLYSLYDIPEMTHDIFPFGDAGPRVELGV